MLISLSMHGRTAACVALWPATELGSVEPRGEPLRAATAGIDYEERT
jgi:hypothetical protein